MSADTLADVPTIIYNIYIMIQVQQRMRKGIKGDGSWMQIMLLMMVVDDLGARVSTGRAGETQIAPACPSMF